MKTASAEIISIGDELTTGALVDTNSAYLSRELSEIGYTICRHSTIGDDLAPMVSLFREAALRSDLVLITGGLGPTEDDLTRQACAEAAGVPLEQNLAAMEIIRTLFAIRGRVMPKSNEIQSWFPRGAKVIDNPHGTAPGFEILIDRTPFGRSGTSKLMTFPGVPVELKEMWNTSGRKLAEEQQYKVTGVRQYFRTRTLRCFGAGESDIESRLPHLIARDHSPRVGITAASGIISLRILAQSSDEAECRRQLDETAALIRDRLGNLVYGEEHETLADIICREFLRRQKTIAALEWGTQGILAQNLPKEVFAGGMTDSGSGSIKHFLRLGKTATLEETLRAFRSETGADAVLAVGSFPDGEEETLREKFFVPVAALFEETYIEQSFPYGLHPAIVKTVFVNRALDLLRGILAEK